MGFLWLVLLIIFINFNVIIEKSRTVFLFNSCFNLYFLFFCRGKILLDLKATWFYVVHTEAEPAKTTINNTGRGQVPLWHVENSSLYVHVQHKCLYKPAVVSTPPYPPPRLARRGLTPILLIVHPES
jgi:hypothetical protein